MFKWYKLNFFRKITFRKITIWSRFNKDQKRYEHNHIENGFQTRGIPQGHPSWKSGTWKKKYGWLDDEDRVQTIWDIVLNEIWDIALFELPMIIFFVCLVIGIAVLILLVDSITYGHLR